MSWSAPPDPRVFHGYSDAPSHSILVTVGWCLSGGFVLLGFLGLFMMGAPSDPCAPDGVGCGPEPTTFGAVGVGFLVAAVVAAGWSLFWQARDRRYRFQPPPNWPAVELGWRPPRGWTPPPTFPQAPEGWNFWR
ncbi:hypothetical protein ACFWUU_13910 [Kribbella sp. NPDC058693]|uniref:hypothetical protein n=1 Tax=Kribbella sp. NPDC058693 TaxID=3346602 RepID=UPI00366159C0